MMKSFFALSICSVCFLFSSQLMADVTLTDVTGTVVLVNDDDSLTPVSEGQAFPDDAVLRIATGSSSEVTVNTPNGSITLGINAVLRYSPFGSTLEQGRARITDADGLVLNTPDGVLEANGTALVAVGEQGGSNVTAVNVQSGTVSVSGAPGSEAQVVAAGNSVSFAEGSTPTISTGTVALPGSPATSIAGRTGVSSQAQAASGFVDIVPGSQGSIGAADADNFVPPVSGIGVPSS